MVWRHFSEPDDDEVAERKALAAQAGAMALQLTDKVPEPSSPSQEEAWAMLDTVGAQFLWWTWHSSEPLYQDREGGVPIASSFWIMSNMMSLAWLLHGSIPIE